MQRCMSLVVTEQGTGTRRQMQAHVLHKHEAVNVIELDQEVDYTYGVALLSRICKIIGLFCKRVL